MIYSFLLSLFLYYIYIYLKTTKSLHMLQQNRYNRGKKYWLWLKQNPTKNFINISLLTFITIFFCFIDSYFSMVYIFNVIFFVLALILVNKKDQEKLPLVYTSRIRLSCDFTEKYFENIGFSWKPIDKNYLIKYINYFKSVDFI